MRKDKNMIRRQLNDVRGNLKTLEMQMAAHEEKDGEKVIFEHCKVVPDVCGGPVKGYVLVESHIHEFSMPGFESKQIPLCHKIKFSELPKLIKFLTIVAGKNGIHLG